MVGQHFEVIPNPYLFSQNKKNVMGSSFSSIAFKNDFLAFSGESGLISFKSSFSVIGLLFVEASLKLTELPFLIRVIEIFVSHEVNQNHSFLLHSLKMLYKWFLVLF